MAIEGWTWYNDNIDSSQYSDFTGMRQKAAFVMNGANHKMKSR